jgi:hypothetical protein
MILRLGLGNCNINEKCNSIENIAPYNLPPPQAFQKYKKTNGKACRLIFQDGGRHKPK